MKKYRKMLLPVVGVISLSTASVFLECRAQALDWTVSGRVLEKETKRPLPGVLIAVREIESISTVSDAEGRFDLTFPGPGLYTLTATATRTWLDKILGAEAPVTLTIELTAESPPPSPTIYLRSTVALPEVVVRAQRNPDKVGKTVISGDQLRQVPGSAGDPLKGLQALPGVAMVNDASSAPAIRGSGPGDNAYYVDSLPVGKLFHFDGLSVFNGDLIEDFNLYSAAFGPQYRNVTGAVLDVALRNPRTDRLGGKTNVSLIGADFLVEGPVSGNQSFYFAARRSYFDLLIGERENKGVTRQLPSYYDYQGKYLWNLNDANRLSLHLLGAGDSLKFKVSRDSDVALAQPVLEGTSQIKTSYGTQALVWDSELSADAGNKLALGHTRQLDTENMGSAGTIFAERNTTFVREQLRLQLTVNHEVSLGANYERLNADLDLDFKNQTCTQFDPNCDLTTATRSQLKDSFPVDFWDVSAKDRWRVLPQLTLIGGLRYSRENYLDKSYTEPRVGAEWEWSERTLLTAGWGKHNQFPADLQVLREFGNPKLSHIKAEHSVLGIAQKLDAGWSWKAETYYKKFSDVVVNDPVQIYVNGGSGNAYGVEMLIKKDPTARLSGWFALTLSQSARRNDITGEAFRFQFDQPVNATLVATYRLSNNWSLGAKWTYHTGTPVTPIVDRGTYPDGRVRPIYGAVNSERLPDYHRLDLRLSRSFVFNTWNLNAYFEVINAYNHKNVSGYDYGPNYDKKEAVYQLPLLPFFGIQAEF